MVLSKFKGEQSTSAEKENNKGDDLYDIEIEEVFVVDLHSHALCNHLMLHKYNSRTNQLDEIIQY